MEIKDETLPLLYKIPEAARILAISERKLYELVAADQIPSLRSGKCLRIPLQALKDWIAEQTKSLQT